MTRKNSSSVSDVLTAYNSPGHPAAYSGVNNVAKQMKITNKRAKEILTQSDTYGLHREFKRPSTYNPYYIRRRRDLIQADLIDVSEIQYSNGRIKFLLLIIDVFTKFVWVFPLKNKSGESVSQVLDKWLNDIDLPPRVFQTDKGREFFNAKVTSVLEKYGVRQQQAYGTCKAAIAERANKSIQRLMYSYLTERETKKYINVLPKLIQSYNTRPHRTIKGFTPQQADKKSNEKKIWKIYDEKFKSIPRQKVKFAIGDLVRVKIDAKVLSRSSRSYNRQFNEEFYQIRRINNKLQIPMYYLTATDDDEDIKGGFYANELSKVSPNSVFQIERVVRSRRASGKRPAQSLVKWQGFSDKWNEWVPSKNINVKS